MLCYEKSGMKKLNNPNRLNNTNYKEKEVRSGTVHFVQVIYLMTRVQKRSDLSKRNPSSTARWRIWFVTSYSTSSTCSSYFSWLTDNRTLIRFYRIRTWRSVWHSLDSTTRYENCVIVIVSALMANSYMKIYTLIPTVYDIGFTFYLFLSRTFLGF